MPAPPARMRSASVPCGTSSSSISPARYLSVKARGSDERGNEQIILAHHAGIDHRGDADAAVAGIVVDDGEVLRAARRLEAVDQRVDQLDRRAGAAEAADHHGHAILDARHRRGEIGDCLVHAMLSRMSARRSLSRATMIGRRRLPSNRYVRYVAFVRISHKCGADMTIAERDIMGGLAKGLLVIETFTRRAAAPVDRGSVRGVGAGPGHGAALPADARRISAMPTMTGSIFTLTPRVLRLGTACLATMPLPQLVQPLLDQLSDAIGRKLVGVDPRRRRDRLCRARRAAQGDVDRADAGLAPAGLLHLDGAGPARRPARERGARRAAIGASASARTRYTKTDLDAIMAELDRVRGQGYALIDQEVEMGLRSIAVPAERARRDHCRAQYRRAANAGQRRRSGRALSGRAEACPERTPRHGAVRSRRHVDHRHRTDATARASRPRVTRLPICTGFCPPSTTVTSLPSASLTRMTVSLPSRSTS